MSKKNALHFLECERQEPERKSVSPQTNFLELKNIFIEEEAKSQSKRCLDCGNPYCQWSCPVHNHIPEWLALVQQGRIIEAAQLCHATNSLPEICGRVCPQDRLCEKACTLNDGFGAVTIGEIEKYINDTALSQGWIPEVDKLRKELGKVAIIGAGPAGLSCAHFLIQKGIQVEVFEKQSEIGGLLTFGIPAFKLEKDIMRRRKSIYEKMGVKFHFNSKVDHVVIKKIIKQFDAVFVATGAYTPKNGQLNIDNIKGVYQALPYLIGVIKHHEKYPFLKEDTYVNLSEKRVIVLGGGDTAMDCARTAIRQGAKHVYCIYRRDREQMPGSVKEVNNAIDEGVEFLFNLQPVTLKQDNGYIKAVEFECTKENFSTACKKKGFITVLDDRKIMVEADSVVIAFGFEASPPNWLNELGVLVDKNKKVLVHNADKAIESKVNTLPYQTSTSYVFAGGDMVRGADLVVHAIADGQQAAQGIIHFLKHKENF